MPSISRPQSPADWESMLKVSGWAPKWPQKHKPARHAPGACAPAPVAAPIGPVPGPLARAAFGPRVQAASHLGRRRTRDVRALRKIPAGTPSFYFSRGPDPLVGVSERVEGGVPLGAALVLPWCGEVSLGGSSILIIVWVEVRRVGTRHGKGSGERPGWIAVDTVENTVFVQ